MIDSNGSVVNTWETGGDSKILPGGNIITGLYFQEWTAMNQAVDCLVELDWDGNVVWPPNAKVIEIPGVARYCDPNGTVVTTGFDPEGNAVSRIHHDSQREGNPVGYYAPGQDALAGGGTTLFLANDFPDPSTTTHISNFPLYNDKIYEFAADGTTILWEWDPIDHIDAGQGSSGDLGLGFSTGAREAIKTIQAPPPGSEHPEKDDWLHMNTVAYVGKNHWCPNENSSSCDHRFHPDNVIFNSREANIAGIIARHDHPDGDWVSGDIVWRIGPDFPNTPNKLDMIIGAHMVHMIPRGLQGAGNILIFDNGGAAGYGTDSLGNPVIKKYFRNYSRVLEIDPISMDIIWQYERPDSTPLPGENFAPFFSAFVAGAQRLQNGNTLITEGMTGRIFEVDRFGNLVWEFVSPFGPFPPMGQGAPFGNVVYRAYRIPTNWVPSSYLK